MLGSTLFGIYCLSFDVHAFSSYSWTETNATVLESFYGLDNQSHDYRLFFSYHYSVNNISYTSTQIAPNTYSQSIDSIDPVFNATLFVTKFPVNSTIQVYYNPSNPNDVVLYRGLSSYDYIIFSQVILVFCVYIFSFLPSISNFSDQPELLLDKFLFVFPFFILLAFLCDIILFMIFGVFIFPQMILLPLIPLLIIEGLFISLNPNLPYSFLNLFTIIFFIIQIIALKIIFQRKKLSGYNKFGYVVQDKSIQFSNNDNRWILTVHGNYFQTNELLIPFEFTCPKKFTSEASALQFFAKNLNSRIPINDNKYCVYIPENNSSSSTKRLFFGYEVYSKYFSNLVLVFILFYADLCIFFNLVFSSPSFNPNLNKNTDFSPFFAILSNSISIAFHAVFSLNFTFDELFFVFGVLALIIMFFIHLLLTFIHLSVKIKTFLKVNYFPHLQRLS